ncbi:CSI2 [Fusarium subglutinans]|uniref:CSI2 n=1 Tax=Gibberella subglutinans TaxID=42677 RepID=A0A8H5Q5J6_GIBSU|nr:CSI2 [Fusarium subglutinans]KAF5607928.1 CSI2 [Fusarium subglutinans]
MRPVNYLPRPDLLVSVFASVSLYGGLAMAQDTKDDPKNNDPSAVPEAADSKNSDANKPTNTAAESAKESSDGNKAEPASTETKDNAKPASTKDEQPSNTAGKEESKSTAKDDQASTATGEGPTKTKDVQSTITSIVSSGTEEAMPTLTRYKPIPTYPAASVPPTNNAPFMRHSSAPDGTVFIAVGAILGALGLAILLWRLIVGILLHRSVERAAKAQHDENAKTGFPAPPAPFYKYTDTGSTMSLSAGRGVRRTTRGPVLSSTPSASNLFFSPTAAASGNGAGNRGSAFLPSGFYAAGTSSPGGHHENNISMTNLRPDSRGHFGTPSRHTLNPSPPDSPSFQGRRDISNSTLNLNRPSSQRAPSAFLEDLLADDPSSLPPPHIPASTARRSSYGSGSTGAHNRI